MLIVNTVGVVVTVMVAELEQSSPGMTVYALTSI